SRAKGLEAYVDRDNVQNTAGIEDKEDVIRGDLMLLAVSTNNFLIKIMLYVGMALVAFAFLYTSVGLALYLALTRHGVVTGKMAEKYMKVSKLPVTRSKENTKKLL